VRLDSGVELTFHPFENPGDSGCFQVVERRLDGEGRLAHGKVGDADSTLARGRDILHASLACLEDDPAALVHAADVPPSEVRQACLARVSASGWRLGAIPEDL